VLSSSGSSPLGMLDPKCDRAVVQRSVTTRPATWRHVPQEWQLQLNRCESPKSGVGGYACPGVKGHSTFSAMFFQFRVSPVYTPPQI